MIPCRLSLSPYLSCCCVNRFYCLFRSGNTAGKQERARGGSPGASSQAHDLQSPSTAARERASISLLPLNLRHEKFLWTFKRQQHSWQILHATLLNGSCVLKTNKRAYLFGVPLERERVCRGGFFVFVSPARKVTNYTANSGSSSFLTRGSPLWLINLYLLSIWRASEMSLSQAHTRIHLALNLEKCRR